MNSFNFRTTAAILYMKEYHQNHSFTKAPASTQLVAYALLAIEFLVFVLCLQGNIDDPSARIIIITFFILTYVGIVITGCITSLTDTSEPLIRLKSDNSTADSTQQRDYLHCHICKSKVQLKTRHCKVCNLCIEGFDHHCIWINNCIGKSNYKSFMAMLIFVASNFTIFQSSVIILWTRNQWNTFIVQMIINWTFGLVLLVFTILVFILLSFHIYLIATNQTTLDFYLSQKKGITVQPEKKQQLQPLQQRFQPENSNEKTNHNMNLSNQASVVIAFESKQTLINTQCEDTSNKQNKNELEEQYKIQSKEPQKDQQLVDNEKNDEKEEDTAQATLLIRRSKSIEYVLGKLLVHTPTKRKTDQVRTERPNSKLKKYHQAVFQNVFAT